MRSDKSPIRFRFGMILRNIATFLMLRRRLPLAIAPLAVSLARSALVAALAGGAAWMALQAVDGGGYFVRLAAASVAYGLVLAAAATVLRVPEWLGVVRRFRRR